MNELLYSENCVILNLQLFCHNTLALQTTDRQTTSHDNNVTLQCNCDVPLKINNVSGADITEQHIVLYVCRLTLICHR